MCIRDRSKKVDALSGGGAVEGTYFGIGTRVGGECPEVGAGREHPHATQLGAIDPTGGQVITKRYVLQAQVRAIFQKTTALKVIVGIAQYVAGYVGNVPFFFPAAQGRGALVVFDVRPCVDQGRIAEIQDIIAVHELKEDAQIEAFIGNFVGKTAEEFGLGTADYLSLIHI